MANVCLITSIIAGQTSAAKRSTQKVHVCVHNGPMHPYLIQWVIYLTAKFFQIWSMRAHADRPLCPFDGSLLFAEHVLTFWHKRCSRLALYFLCPHPAIGHFFKEPWFLGGG